MELKVLLDAKKTDTKDSVQRSLKFGSSKRIGSRNLGHVTM